MSDTSHCPKCGGMLAADAPAGLCPKCLLQGGLASESEPSLGYRATTPSPGAASFQPPAIEELAGCFPQLEILELLGQGGMGAVYKARQSGLDRLVAVKILPPQVGRDGAFAERFAREARALARLSHPNIVGVHDFGQTTAGSGEGLFYFIMEYVEGANLRHAMQAGNLQPAEALAIVPQICDALQYAHDEGVVHRDIKPENILLDKKGRVKIADFGLSKLLGDDRPEVSLTGTHQVMGTLRYMAPEQMQGTRTVDHRADIYSLGVVFYELLTGDLPMGRFDPPSHKVQIDVRLDEVVLRTLAMSPDKRYQRASEVKTQLEGIQSSPQRSPFTAPTWSDKPAAAHSSVGPTPATGRKFNGTLVLLGILAMMSIPVLGVAGMILVQYTHGPTWITALAGLLLVPLLLLAAAVFIVLGLRGRKGDAASPVMSGGSSPARASNGGAVALVIVLVLAVTCLPMLLVGGLALVGAAIFLVPSHTVEYHGDANEPHVTHEEAVTRQSGDRATPAAEID